MIGYAIGAALFIDNDHSARLISAGALFDAVVQTGAVFDKNKNLAGIFAAAVAVTGCFDKSAAAQAAHDKTFLFTIKTNIEVI